MATVNKHQIKYIDELLHLGHQGGNMMCTPDRVHGLLPYLNEPEVNVIIECVECGNSFQKIFAGPPRLIRGAEHQIKIYHDPKHGPRISWAGSFRRRESYINSFLPGNWRNYNLEWRDRCADYAEVSWGDKLTWDRSHTRLGIGVMDVPTWTQCVDRVAAIGLSPSSPGRAPAVQRLTDRITHIIPECMFARAEFFGCDTNHTTLYFCGECGGSLTFDGCNYCGETRQVPVPLHGFSETVMVIPIPLRIVHELDWCDLFSIDPIHATKAHYQEWIRSGPTSPLYKRQSRERVITFEETQ